MRAAALTALACAAALAGAGSGSSASSRIVDRTLVCTIVQGNPREVTVQAQSGTREGSSRWHIRPSASFDDPKSYPGASAWLSAGWPPLDADALTYSPTCRPSSARVPLSSRGLTGGIASPTADRYDCVVPKKILVRLRGVFRSPTSLRLTTRARQRYWVARGAMIEGSLAVRTQTGRPTALATVASTGKAQILVSDACGPSS